MPGRQAHGRPLSGGPSATGKSKKRTKSRSNKKALNAFAIASEEYADRARRTPRNRELDVPRDGGKHAREEDEDEDGDEDDDDEGAPPPRKMRRGNDKDRGGAEDVEYGSDSSGNEWRVGAVDEDDDSEIDSDEAFGESDEERFEDYAFRGSTKKNQKKKQQQQDDEDDEDDEDEDVDDADGASLGSDAIDLAAALDMSMSEDDGAPGADQLGVSSDEDESSGDSASGDESSDVEDDEDDDASESGVNAWVSQFSGVKDADEQDAPSTTTKPKLGLKDLGLLGVKDPQLKKSLKLMTKEEKSTKPHKLEVPLARRQQAKLDRSAAYEKTTQTLDRWTETVKHNRRAEHLVFPLPQTETGLARHDNSEIKPLDHKTPATELEQTIMAIMEESGLGPSAKKETEDTQGAEDADGQGLSVNNSKSLWQEKRRERELKSREDARAKRIKKIKSKAYHRVHRKQRERDEIKEREVMAASGEIDSEEERETQDRQRAKERMGARHRESKWAKMSNKGGRAAWDDDVRTGVADMARRDEELRRRIEGKPSKANEDDDDDDSDYSGDSEDVDERKRLLRQLDDVSAAEDTQPRSKLMNMEFMKKAEAAKRKANDDLVAQIRRDLDSDDEDRGESDDETEDVGRRKFGLASEKKLEKASELRSKANKKGKKSDETELETARNTLRNATVAHSQTLSAPLSQEQSASTTAGAWSQPTTTSGPSRKQRGKKTGSNSADVLLELGTDSVAVAPSAAPAKAPKPTKSKKQTIVTAEYSSDDDEEASHLPIQFREQDLIEKAFGGLDVVAEFEAEKAAVATADDDVVVDNTLPGWGSWVGDGVSSRERKRHAGRFLEKKEGVRRREDRRDRKLRGVIISEKRSKKNDKYMASQLPHPFESRLQYERALRLPVGPEWMTKETFQEATKPRVLMKQGVIAPIAKPTY
ncbi:small-subunit processome [Whalleya microplaca]|nr:small-subunit processome [Whalleya microplaca]